MKRKDKEMKGEGTGKSYYPTKFWQLKAKTLDAIIAEQRKHGKWGQIKDIVRNLFRGLIKWI